MSERQEQSSTSLRAGHLPGAFSPLAARARALPSGLSLASKSRGGSRWSRLHRRMMATFSAPGLSELQWLMFPESSPLVLWQSPASVPASRSAASFLLSTVVRERPVTELLWRTRLMLQPLSEARADRRWSSAGQTPPAQVHVTAPLLTSDSASSSPLPGLNARSTDREQASRAADESPNVARAASQHAASVLSAPETLRPSWPSADRSAFGSTTALRRLNPMGNTLLATRARVGGEFQQGVRILSPQNLHTLEDSTSGRLSTKRAAGAEPGSHTVGDQPRAELGKSLQNQDKLHLKGDTGRPENVRPDSIALADESSQRSSEPRERAREPVARDAHARDELALDINAISGAAAVRREETQAATSSMHVGPIESSKVDDSWRQSVEPFRERLSPAALKVHDNGADVEPEDEGRNKDTRPDSALSVAHQRHAPGQDKSAQISENKRDNNSESPIQTFHVSQVALALRRQKWLLMARGLRLSGATFDESSSSAWLGLQRRGMGGESSPWPGRAVEIREVGPSDADGWGASSETPGRVFSALTGELTTFSGLSPAALSLVLQPSADEVLHLTTGTASDGSLGGGQPDPSETTVKAATSTPHGAGNSSERLSRRRSFLTQAQQPILRALEASAGWRGPGVRAAEATAPAQALARQTLARQTLARQTPARQALAHETPAHEAASFQAQAPAGPVPATIVPVSSQTPRAATGGAENTHSQGLRSVMEWLTSGLRPMGARRGVAADATSSLGSKASLASQARAWVRKAESQDDFLTERSVEAADGRALSRASARQSRGLIGRDDGGAAAAIPSPPAQTLLTPAPMEAVALTLTRGSQATADATKSTVGASTQHQARTAASAGEQRRGTTSDVSTVKGMETADREQTMTSHHEAGDRRASPASLFAQPGASPDAPAHSAFARGGLSPSVGSPAEGSGRTGAELAAPAVRRDDGDSGTGRRRGGDLRGRPLRNSRGTAQRAGETLLRAVEPQAARGVGAQASMTSPLQRSDAKSAGISPAEQLLTTSRAARQEDPLSAEASLSTATPALGDSPRTAPSQAESRLEQASLPLMTADETTDVSPSTLLLRQGNLVEPSATSTVEPGLSAWDLDHARRLTLRSGWRLGGSGAEPSSLDGFRRLFQAFRGELTPATATAGWLPLGLPNTILLTPTPGSDGQFLDSRGEQAGNRGKEAAATKGAGDGSIPSALESSFESSASPRIGRPGLRSVGLVARRIGQTLLRAAWMHAAASPNGLSALAGLATPALISLLTEAGVSSPLALIRGSEGLDERASLLSRAQHMRALQSGSASDTNPHYASKSVTDAAHISHSSRRSLGTMAGRSISTETQSGLSTKYIEQTEKADQNNSSMRHTSAHEQGRPFEPRQGQDSSGIQAALRWSLGRAVRFGDGRGWAQQPNSPMVLLTSASESEPMVLARGSQSNAGRVRGHGDFASAQNRTQETRQTTSPAHAQARAGAPTRSGESAHPQAALTARSPLSGRAEHGFSDPAAAHSNTALRGHGASSSIGPNTARELMLSEGGSSASATHTARRLQTVAGRDAAERQAVIGNRGLPLPAPHSERTVARFLRSAFKGPSSRQRARGGQGVEFSPGFSLQLTPSSATRWAGGVPNAPATAWVTVPAQASWTDGSADAAAHRAGPGAPARESGAVQPPSSSRGNSSSTSGASQHEGATRTGGTAQSRVAGDGTGAGNATLVGGGALEAGRHFERGPSFGRAHGSTSAPGVVPSIARQYAGFSPSSPTMSFLEEPAAPASAPIPGPPGIPHSQAEKQALESQFLEMITRRQGAAAAAAIQDVLQRGSRQVGHAPAHLMDPAGGAKPRARRDAPESTRDIRGMQEGEILQVLRALAAREPEATSLLRELSGVMSERTRIRGIRRY